MGTGAKSLFLYGYMRRQDLRESTGFLNMLLTGTINSHKGARFLTEAEQRQIMNPGNSGLLVDGKAKRLALDESYKHLLLVAQTGAGKTTKYIIPNILKLAENQNSILVTDPSGEIFAHTSGYMQSRGFKVLKFDPKDPEHSLFFNPLRFVFTNGEVDQVKVSLLASSLIASSLPGERDFWHIGAEGIIEFMALCLLNCPKEYHNLYNLYRLVEAITPTGELLSGFMAKYGREPKLKSKWLSYIKNSNETFLGQLITAQTALRPLYNDQVAKILSKNSLRFSDFRKEKTILYLTFPVHQAEFYTFTLNLFYTQFFHEYMEKRPDKSDLPVFVLYDEFGSANIPHFDIIATNIRKYNVSLSIILQSFSQLETQYGKNKSKTILEGAINSMLFYSGAGIDTALAVERMLGKVIRDETYTMNSREERTDRKQFNLLNADEIRTLPNNQAFFITGNQLPVMIDIVAWYESRELKKKCSFSEAYLDSNNYSRYSLKSILEDLSNNA
jgi:type IV secretory pathway TraG/TraD family ATPase VirD4